MGQANKWAGGSGGKIGKSAYGSHVAAQYAHLSPSTRSSADSVNKGANGYPVLGTTSENMTRSSHNDISRFMSGIQKQGQYNSQPESTYKASYKPGQTHSISKPETPSGASKMSQRVPNKKMKAPDRYNPTTPNMMKNDNIGKMMNKSRTMNKLASNMKRGK